MLAGQALDAATWAGVEVFRDPLMPVPAMRLRRARRDGPWFPYPGLSGRLGLPDSLEPLDIPAAIPPVIPSANKALLFSFMIWD